MPIATFVATLVLTDGAPLQSPFRATSAGSGMPAAVHVAPGFEHGQPATKARAGIPTPISHAPAAQPDDARRDDVRPDDAHPRASEWRPPDPDRLARHRTDAAWDRLDRLAAGGNRDALVFRTLMQSSDFVRPARLDTP